MHRKDVVRGRRVLVTGAGGSVGSALCRRVRLAGPAEIVALDHDDTALHALQTRVGDSALVDADDVVLCDVRDTVELHRVLRERRPEVVLHAAALKHLPLLEAHPAEAVKTNVWGTRNVLDACEAAGVGLFVNISTDKAADPTSVLGWSKRLGERLTADRARAAGGTYLSVRFGNVLGSRGSVLTVFERQIAAGGPVTVTDPEVTRYVMSVDEACELVVQAAAIGSPGEVLVLDMGEPVRILDVASRMIAASGDPTVGIEITGLRPGEKVHEHLFGADEPRDVRRAHPLVSHVPVPPLAPHMVDGLLTSGGTARIRDALAVACDLRVTSQRS